MISSLNSEATSIFWKSEFLAKTRAWSKARASATSGFCTWSKTPRFAASLVILTCLYRVFSYNSSTRITDANIIGWWVSVHSIFMPCLSCLHWTEKYLDYDKNWQEKFLFRHFCKITEAQSSWTPWEPLDLRLLEMRQDCATQPCHGPRGICRRRRTTHQRQSSCTT